MPGLGSALVATRSYDVDGMDASRTAVLIAAMQPEIDQCVADSG
ncbi:MAG: hypothetical protein ACLP50_09975 [Solirubrobacteraceae bacterium]